MQCPKCNMNLKDDAQYCMYCGMFFNSTELQQSIGAGIIQTNNINNQTMNNNSKSSTKSIMKTILVVVILIIIGWQAYKFFLGARVSSNMLEGAQKDIMLDIERKYLFQASQAFTNGELKVYDNRPIITGTYYYVSIEGSKDDSLLYPISIENQDSSDKGYILLKYDDSTTNYYACISRKIGNQTLYVSSFNNGQEKSAFSLNRGNVTNEGKCETDQDFYNKFNPLRLVAANTN